MNPIVQYQNTNARRKRGVRGPPACDAIAVVNIVLGMLPIAIGYCAGGEARQPLGLVIVGGLLFSQLVTLYLTPCYYTYLSELQNWWRRRKSVKVVAPEAVQARS
jgi:hypothetical protein